MDSLTVSQFLSGVVTIIIVQLFAMWNNNRNLKAQAPLTNAQSESEISEAWERVANGYAKQIETLRNLETENAELRPLVLKLALQAEAIKQTQRDKEDWKRYAEKLTKQVEDCGQMPIPFRRLPTSNGDTGPYKPVSPVLPAE